MIFINKQNTRYQIGSADSDCNILLPSQYSLSDLPFITVTEHVNEREIEILDPETQETRTETVTDISYSFSLDASLKSSTIAARDLENAQASLRATRDQLLRDTDFTQLVDAPLTAEKKEEFRLYRQALRDLPETVQDVFNPTFPVKPE